MAIEDSSQMFNFKKAKIILVSVSVCISVYLSFFFSSYSYL